MVLGTIIIAVKFSKVIDLCRLNVYLFTTGTVLLFDLYPQELFIYKARVILQGAYISGSM